MAILPENETTEFENRTYINPEVSLNEQMSFIDNLRSNQGERNAEIQQQTYNLGTAVPSNLGGLTGGEGYWTSRYQTPQTVSATADLRATAQAQALNDVLSNEQAKWKKRYNDAYKSYQKRSNSGGGSGGGNTGNTGNPTTDGEVETKVDKETPQGSSEQVGGQTFDHSSWGDFVAGKGERTISYVLNGRTYYANIFNQTGYDGNRYTGMDTSTGMSYEGQHALNFLNDVIAKGGKIYGPDGNEITPYQALTGSTGR